MNQRIKQLRIALGITQLDMATALGVTGSGISGIEIGRSEPSDLLIRAICATYHVREDWLRTGNGDMFEADPGDAVATLAAQYRLSPAKTALVRAFVELSEDDQEALLDFIQSTARKLTEADASAADAKLRAATVGDAPGDTNAKARA